MTPISSSRSVGAASERRLRTFVLYLAIWTLYAAYQFGDDVVNSPGNWRRADVLAIEVIVAFVWALITPIVLALARRFPIERPRVGRHVLVQALLSLLCSAGVAVVSAGVMLALGAGGSIVTLTFVQVLPAAFAGGIHQHLCTYWGIIAVCHAIRYHYAYLERDAQAAALALRAAELRRDLDRAQLRALKAQLEPHFLYNTLNTIMVLVRQKSEIEALEMLRRLRELLECVLRDAGAHEVPLDRELEYLRLYLAIEQVRFRDRLRVEIAVEPGLLDAAVAYMCLQPIVENSIRYGVAQRSAPGTIRIRASREREVLKLLVQDDGVGYDTPTLSHRQGIGLANTRARLETLYGRDATLEVRRAPRGGTIATIVVPYRALAASAVAGA
jgi:two-component system LytT family sensor kinase